jgi:hypothetical protein
MQQSSKLFELPRGGLPRVRDLEGLHVMPANAHNRSYLKTKASRSGHLLALERSA